MVDRHKSSYSFKNKGSMIQALRFKTNLTQKFAAAMALECVVKSPTSTLPTHTVTAHCKNEHSSQNPLLFSQLCNTSVSAIQVCLWSTKAQLFSFRENYKDKPCAPVSNNCTLLWVHAAPTPPMDISLLKTSSQHVSEKQFLHELSTLYFIISNPLAFH